MPMLIPVERLVDGVVETLLQQVLPAVASRYARGQLYAVVDVLQNLRDRIEEKSALLRVEAEGAEAALARAATALRGGAGEEAGARIEAVLASAPAADAPPAERVVALRAAVVLALQAIDALPADVAEGARAALGGHLGMQALREVAVLKPSLLAEISQG
jgi:hypothetical protein